MNHQKLDKLKQLIDNQPLVWEPKKGDMLTGVIVDLKAYFDNALTIEGECGSLHLVHLTPMIKHELSIAGAEIGDLIAIKYLGRSGEIDYFAVIVDKSEAAR